MLRSCMITQGNKKKAGWWVGQNLKKRRGNQYRVGKYHLPEYTIILVLIDGGNVIIATLNA